MDWLATAEFAAWVTESCERHGVPVKVSDARVVAEVAVLLSGGTVRPDMQLRRPARAGSETPDGIDAGRVEGLDAGSGARVDDTVMEHRSDDGVLASQGEIGPLSA